MNICDGVRMWGLTLKKDFQPILLVLVPEDFISEF